MAVSQITDHVAQAVARLPERMKNSTKLIALLTAFVTPVQAFEDVAWAVLLERILDNMTGIRLDDVGVLVGQERGGLSDADYRRYLYSRIRVNRSSGLLEELYDIIRLFVGDQSAVLQSVLPISGDPPGLRLLVDSPIMTDAEAAALASFLGDAIGAGKPLNLVTTAQVLTDSFMFGRTTFLSQNELTGATTINVYDSSYFPPGSRGVLGKGLTVEENCDVVSRTATTITISPGLGDNHSQDDSLTLLNYGGFGTDMGKGFFEGKLTRSSVD